MDRAALRCLAGSPHSYANWSSKRPMARWAHEIKYDGYRLHTRIETGRVQLLTRAGLDWSAKYPATIEALRTLNVRQAYIEGELCGVRPDGITSFAMIQAASDRGNAAGLVYFAFDLPHLDGRDLMPALLLERKEALERLLIGAPACAVAGYCGACAWAAVMTIDSSRRP